MPRIDRERRREAGLGRFLAPFTNHTPPKGKIGHRLVRFEPDTNCTNERHVKLVWNARPLKSSLNEQTIVCFVLDEQDRTGSLGLMQARRVQQSESAP